MARQPVELTPSAARKLKQAQKKGLLKKVGTGQARKAGNAMIKNQDTANAARRAADKAMGITRR